MSEKKRLPASLVPKIPWYHLSRVIGWWKAKKVLKEKLKEQKKYKYMGCVTGNYQDPTTKEIWCTITWHFFENGLGQRKVKAMTNRPYDGDRLAKQHSRYIKYIYPWLNGKWNTRDLIKAFERV